MKKRIAKVLALVLSVSMLAGVLAGCGGGQSSGSQGGSSQGGSSQQQSSAGSALRLATTTGDGFSTDDKVPCPWYNRTMATNLMFRSLLIADASLTSTEPDLATVEVSEDGLVYTITLKDGLKWSDGEALTVDDVIWSLQTVLKCTQVNALYTTAFNYISDLSAEGNVITMTLTAPYSTMKDVLAQFAILPKHSLESEDPLQLHNSDFWKKPVTSGMYMMEEMNVGNYFSMVPNPNYEGQAPKIQKVINYFVSDFVTAANSGSADYVYGNDANLVNAVSQLSNFTRYEVDVLFYKYFIFNMSGVDGNENPAMQNEAVRAAVIQAVDRAALASLYPEGVGTLINSGVPNSYPSYNGFEYTYDAEAAKKAIEESGYDMSRTLRILYYNNDQTSVDIINAIVYYLEQCGLKVDSTLSNNGTADLFQTRNYDIGFKGLSAFSINEWYNEYLSTNSNFSNIFGGDTSFDSLIQSLASVTDETQRDQILKDLQALEQEKMYKVPLFTVGSNVFVDTSRVSVPEGVEFCNPLYGCDVDFANWEIKA